jgi:hypothetical protein
MSQKLYRSTHSNFLCEKMTNYLLFLIIAVISSLIAHFEWRYSISNSLKSIHWVIIVTVIFFHLVVLGVKFMALFLSGRCFNTWGIFLKFTCFILFIYWHVQHCLDHFSPLLSTPSLPTGFQGEPVLPFSPILLKRRYKQ